MLSCAANTLGRCLARDVWAKMSLQSYSQKYGKKVFWISKKLPCIASSEILESSSSSRSKNRSKNYEKSYQRTSLLLTSIDAGPDLGSAVSGLLVAQSELGLCSILLKWWSMIVSERFFVITRSGLTCRTFALTFLFSIAREPESKNDLCCIAFLRSLGGSFSKLAIEMTFCPRLV